MNTRYIFLIPAAMLLLFVFTYSAAGKPDDSIIINNADEVLEDAFAIDQNLLDLFDAVEPRIIAQYANELWEISLIVIPGDLGTLLAQVPERIIMQYANLNQQEALTYPVAFFNDSTAPVINNVTASRYIIKWTTDEYADSTVMYGTQSGNYSETVDDPLYRKQHGVKLSGLVPGEKYYLKVSSTDRSGNTSTSAEYSFTNQITIFLPVTMNND